MARHGCTLVVRNASGEPLAETRFVVESASEPVPELAYVTGLDGSAHVGLPPGEASLRFFPVNGASQVLAVRVRDEPDATYEVALIPKGFELR